MNYPLNMSICSLTADEALGDWLRCRHFHCDLEEPNFHQWNRCVFCPGAAVSLLMLTLETQRHCIHEKYCWQQYSYPAILRYGAKILISLFTVTFLNLFARHPTISSISLSSPQKTITPKKTLIWKEGNSVNFVKCYNIARIK